MGMLEGAQKAVEDFHKKYGFPIGTKPEEMDPEYFKLRISWMLEEIQELLVAKDLVEKSDALTDLIYYAIGTFVVLGIDGSKIFEIVQESNMTKAHNEVRQYEGGKPVKDVDWVPPEEKIASALQGMLVAHLNSEADVDIPAASE